MEGGSDAFPWVVGFIALSTVGSLAVWFLAKMVWKFVEAVLGERNDLIQIVDRNNGLLQNIQIALEHLTAAIESREQKDQENLERMEQLMDPELVQGEVRNAIRNVLNTQRDAEGDDDG